MGVGDQWDFWEKFGKPNEKQISLDEINSPKQLRLRKVKRDYNLINKAQQWEARIFLKVLDYALQTLSIPHGYKGGRPSLAPLSEKIKICCIKQYNLKGARRSVYDIESARNNNFLFVSKISENFFNRINDYMKDTTLTPYLQQLISTLSEPLIEIEKNFAVDGSGWKTSAGKPNYMRIRTDRKVKREYIGLHIISGISTHTIPHCVVSKGYEHDSKFFEPLVLRTKEIFNINEVYGDGAYLTKKNVDLCHSLNITSYLKPKGNVVVNDLKNTAWAKAVERFTKDMALGNKRRYTLRNNVESSFNMVKSIFGDVLRHKIFEARVNELLCRVVCHNVRCLIYAYFNGDIKFPFSILDE